MNILAQQILDNIIELSNKALDNGDERILLCMPSYREELIHAVTQQLSSYFASKKDISLTIKISRKIWTTWKEPRLKKFAEDSDMVAEGDNLTRYRNNFGTPGVALNILLLCGVDKQTDKASLENFYSFYPSDIWKRDMKETFKIWINKCLINAKIDSRIADKLVRSSRADELLISLRSIRAFELDQISSWLENLLISPEITTDKELTNCLYEQLPNAPIGISSMLEAKRGTPLGTYIKSEQSFYNGILYISDSDIEKSIKKLSTLKEKILENQQTNIDFEAIYEQYQNEKCNKNETCAAFIDDVINVIEGNNEDNIITKLKQVPFPFIVDKILKYKEPTEKSSDGKPSVVSVCGHPLEMVYSAAWKAICSLISSKEFNNNQDPIELFHNKFGGFKVRLKKITLNSSSFSDDDQPDLDIYLQRIFGGIREAFKEQQKDFEFDVDLLEIDDEYALTNSRFESKSAKSKLEFTLQLLDKDNEILGEKYIFSWSMLDDDEFLLGCNLIAKYLEEIRDNTKILPCFNIDNYDNLINSSSQEDVLAMFQYSANSLKPLNLLSNEEIHIGDNLRGILTSIAVEYNNLLKNLYQNGLTSLINEELVNYDLFELIKKLPSSIFNSTDRNYGAENATNIILRSFMIIKSRYEGDLSWYASNEERSAIVTILHPCMLEQLHQRYTFLGECFRQLCTQSDFNKQAWDFHVELSELKNPLPGFLVNGTFETHFRGSGLFQRIGTGDACTPVCALSNDDNEGEISERQLTEETSQSRFISRTLTDYVNIHPHASDSLSIISYQSDDVQHMLAAIHDFLLKIRNNTEKSGYTLELTLITQANNTYDVQYWANAYQNMILSKNQPKFEKVNLRIRHRVIPVCDESNNYTCIELPELLKDLPQSDILFINNFVPINRANALKRPRMIDKNQSRLKFPLMERKYVGNNTDPQKKFFREKIVTNTQFQSTLTFAGILFNSRVYANNSSGININQNDLWKYDDDCIDIVEQADFKPWIESIPKIHATTDWVVMVDKNIDENILKETGNTQDTNTRRSVDIIGFGTGIGSCGTLNYTISSCRKSIKDIELALKDRIGSLSTEYSLMWSPDEVDAITKKLIKSGSKLSGLTSIKAANYIKSANSTDYSIHDFMAFSACQHLLIGEPTKLDGQWKFLISLDAYRHWIDLSPERNSNDKKLIPDLLLVDIKLDEPDSRTLDMNLTLIECKLSSGGNRITLIEKAQKQIEIGLKIYKRLFEPCKENEHEFKSARFWRLQLHRLISSHISGKCPPELLDNVNDSLDSLVSGNYNINWNAQVMYFDTQADSKNLQKQIESNYICDTYIIGADYLLDALNDDTTSWNERLSRANITSSLPKFELISELKRAELHQSSSDPYYDEDDDEIELANDDDYNSPEPMTENLATRDKSTNNSQLEKWDDALIDKREAFDASPYSTKSNKKELCLINDRPVNVINEGTRILLGHSSDKKEPIYWEYGNQTLENRHLVIYGKSGTGKTYAIQAILCEMAKNHINSLIIDYTDGYKMEQIQEITIRELNPQQTLLRNEPLPIQPFQCLDDSGNLPNTQELEEYAWDSSSRITNIFKNVYSDIGSQQEGLLKQVIREGIIASNNNFTPSLLLEKLDDICANETGERKSWAVTLKNKLDDFCTRKYFSQEAMLWEDFLEQSDSKCAIIQESGINKDNQTLFTEFILWDLLSTARIKWTANNPHVIVLDEVQRLDHSNGAPLNELLREGRKFGLNLILATQNVAAFDKEARANLDQCGQALFFAPSSSETKTFAEVLSLVDSRYNKDYWTRVLSTLGRGECIAVGLHKASGSNEIRKRAIKIKIASLEERFNELEK